MARCKDTFPCNADGVTLTLDHEETQALYDLLRNVAGDPEKSRRRVTDRIYREIRTAACIDISPNFKRHNDIEGQIDFRP